MKYFKIIIIIFLVFTIVGIGLTMAYKTNSTNIENYYKTGTLSSTEYDLFENTENWKPGDIVDKKLNITNNYESDIAVRVSFTEKWLSNDGKEISNEIDNSKVAIITLANKNDWVKIDDYYYYRYKLQKNESTSSFIYSVTFNRNVNFESNCISSNNEINCTYNTGEYGDSTYTIKIKIEKVQYEKYKDIWDNVKILNNIPLTASDVLIAKANSETINYESGDKGEMFTFDHVRTDYTLPLRDYRYIGDAPKNYVKFNCDDDGENCEIWRIIGVFDVDDGNGYVDKRIKLVRGYELPSTMHWNESIQSDWTISTLKEFLNGDYYNSSNDATYGLKKSARTLIENAKYYLGGRMFNYTLHYGDTEEIYTWERGYATYNYSRPLEWAGNIALMYPSDVYMTYSNGVNDICYNDPYMCNNNEIASTGWIYNTNHIENQNTPIYTWLISQGFLDVSNAYYTMNQGQLYFGHVNSGVFGVRPVLYLKADVKIASGTGEAGSPYVFYN